MGKYKPLIACSILTLLIALSTLIIDRKMMIYNYTDSMEHGFYLIKDKENYDYNDVVVFEVPESVRDLVYERGYLKHNEYLMKKVKAKSGDYACVKGEYTYIKGEILARNMNYDSAGREMPKSDFCGDIGDRKLFVAIEDIDQSFDSRYFGLIDEKDVIGIAKPLLIFN